MRPRAGAPRYGADLTARQITDLLDLRTNAVEAPLHSALARLRAELREQEAGAPEPRRADVQVEL